MFICAILYKRPQTQFFVDGIHNIPRHKFRRIATKLLGNPLGCFDGYKITKDGNLNGPNIPVLRDDTKCQKFLDRVNLKMKPLYSTETSVTNYQST